MSLHERLGFANLDHVLTDSLGFISKAESSPSRDDLIPYTKWNSPIDQARVAMVYYLKDDHDAAACYADRVLVDAADFFFGRWRSEVPTDSGEFDPSWWRTNELWIDVLRAAALWGSFLGDWDRLKTIAGYPGEDCPVDVDYTRQEKAYHLALAAVLHEAPPAESAADLERASTGRKQRTRLVAQALADLVRGDEPSFESSLAGVLGHHAKTFSLKDFTNLVSQDGSILYNLAPAPAGLPRQGRLSGLFGQAERLDARESRHVSPALRELVGRVQHANSPGSRESRRASHALQNPERLWLPPRQSTWRSPAGRTRDMIISFPP